MIAKKTYPKCKYTGPAALDFYLGRSLCKKCKHIEVIKFREKSFGKPNPEFQGRLGRVRLLNTHKSTH